MTAHTVFIVLTVSLTMVHLSMGLTVGFSEVDYVGREEGGKVRVTVSKQDQNIDDVVVDVIPLSFSQFEAMGMNFPLGIDANNLPDPAELEEGRRDFNPDVQTVTFAPSDRFANIDVFINITEDIINEAEEGFFVVLSIGGVIEDPLGLDISRKVSLCRIVDNDRVKISFQQQSYTILETIGKESENLIYLVNEGQIPSELNLTVIVTLTQQNAIKGSDFEVISTVQLLTFYPGDNNITYPFTVINDKVPEDIENFQLSLSIPSGPYAGLYSPGSQPFTIVNIQDDDIVYIGFERREYTVKEGDRFVDVVVELIEPAQIDLFATALLNIVPGTAEEEKDYMRIPPGNEFVDIPTLDNNEYQMTIRIEIVDDDEVETSETFVLQLLRSEGFTLPNVFLSVNETVIIIQDDDAIAEPVGCQEVCDSNAMCIEVSGVLQCVCNPGYTGNGVTCTDINECELGLDECDDRMKCYVADGRMVCVSYAECTNTLGSYTCSCNQGFEGDGRTCNDINECARGLDDCSENAWCINLPGSYDCMCRQGYVGDGRTCTEIPNEPQEEPPEEEEEEEECTPRTRHTHHSHHTHPSRHTHSRSRSGTTHTHTTSHGTTSRSKRSKSHTSHHRTGTHGTTHTRRCGSGTKSRSSTSGTTKSATHTTRTHTHTSRSHTSRSHTSRPHTSRSHTSRSHTSRPHTSRSHTSRSHTSRSHTSRRQSR